MKKIVVVSGSSKGLGLAISRQLLVAGYKIIGISRSLSDEFKELMTNNPRDAHYYSFDLEKTDEIASLVKRLVKEHGRVYGLINNAALGHDGVLTTMHEKEISQLIKVNVESPILLAKYIARSMLLAGEGRIVNVGSIIGSTGFNGLSVYGATKSALGGFTKSLARELGKAGITVNTLAPGYMETHMTEGLVGEKLETIKRRSPLGRLANVDDAAGAAVYLLSDMAKSITGTTITVDAGSTA